MTGGHGYNIPVASMAIHRCLWFVALTALLFSLGCGSGVDLEGHDYGDIPRLDSCISYDFNIVDLGYDDLPNTGYSEAAARDTDFVRDADNVMLSQRDGQAYYHPVGMTHKLYALIDVYHRTGDTTLLQLANKYTTRLIKEAMIFDTAMYFPYHIDYKVHRRDDALLRAPWFSGMAQGEALGVLVRMFKITKDSTLLEFSHRVFSSFLRLRSDSSPWTVFRDSCGCYWIEEYPTQPPSMTLNGFIFAIYGLYDYFLLTADPRAEMVLEDCLSTIKNYLPLFRRTGGISFYNLHFRRFDVNYHRVHIDQLRDLARMTDDPFFDHWADSLNKDYPR
ncbi:MAG: D-glucuronyl C5-epimerase family protein [candidate division Zixibacteria bacterium]|nr:D-glucuronyl C5-epimerase family protein [candidate division Zixibacteria bacterium]MDH3937439.1 D-glucuronyl C5-epimerase family protein [candidate division Zixibacteria bacterium]MDH4035505.1 D-glucuronyl C5-epimerase family protein [candidate division Zixibacteria bacterium]